MNNKTLIKIGGPHGKAELDMLKKRFSRIAPGAEIEIVRDDSLIGGFIAYAGGKVYDASVLSHLNAMKRSFKEADGK